MEAKIVSRELIKPSSPTPKGLLIFDLSLLDHLVYGTVSPAIFFYQSNSDPGDQTFHVRHKLDMLKKSLSLALPRFYPLAGTLRDDIFVECDDGGACFIVAHVNMSLSRFLADPDLISLIKLIPNGSQYALGDPLEMSRCANVQVNVFRCGGIAIGICNPHRCQDGVATSSFLKEWAAAARGGSCWTVSSEHVVSPAKFFPPAKDISLRDSFLNSLSSKYKQGKGVKQRFLFRGESIEALRTRARSPDVKNPSRVEAVSGFIWSCIMEASARNNNCIRRPSMFFQLVDIRQRFKPPVSEVILGNLLWSAIAHWPNAGSHSAEDLLPALVCELRRAVDKIGNEFVSRLSDREHLMESFLEQMNTLRSNVELDYIGCSSWRILDFYNLDFGWGKPAWVSSTGMNRPMFINFVHLIPTRSGIGMEAWITLDEQEMAILQEDPVLRALASVNPSPIAIDSML